MDVHPMDSSSQSYERMFATRFYVDDSHQCVDNSFMAVAAKQVEKSVQEMETHFAKLDASRAFDKIWAVLSMASLLAVMAYGFHWI
jgi:hypothetical protein